MKKSCIRVFSIPFFFLACTSAQAIAEKAGNLRADALIGCYAQNANGPISVRIERDGAHYSLIPLDKDGKEKEVMPLYNREVKADEGLDADIVDAVISNESGFIAVIKSKNGIPINTASPGSDFYLYAPQVGGPLYRRPCPNAPNHAQTREQGR